MAWWLGENEKTVMELSHLCDSSRNIHFLQSSSQWLWAFSKERTLRTMWFLQEVNCAYTFTKTTAYTIVKHFLTFPPRSSSLKLTLSVCILSCVVFNKYVSLSLDCSVAHSKSKSVLLSILQHVQDKQRTEMTLKPRCKKYKSNKQAKQVQSTRRINRHNKQRRHLN